MKILPVLVAFVISRATEIEAADFSYTSRSDTSTVPAFLAVRNGVGYSATDSVLLHSEDITKILNSGNYVTFKSSDDQGGNTVSYAAIPVIRNGDSYSVVTTNQPNVRQGSSYSYDSVSSVATQTEDSSDPDIIVPLRSRDAASNNLKISPVSNRENSFSSLEGTYQPETPFSTRTVSPSLSYGEITSKLASKNDAAPLVSSTRTFISKASGVKTDNPVSFSTSAASVPATLSGSLNNENHLVSQNVHNFESLRVITTPQVSSLSSLETDSISVTAPVRTSPDVSTANAGIVRTISTAANAATTKQKTAIANTARFGDDGKYSANGRTRIVSSPGIKSNPVILGSVSRDAGFSDGASFTYEDVIPGRSNIDYPVLRRIPRTSFSCRGRAYGYYADEESSCQVYHVCHGGLRSSFLCPNGTIFDQSKLVCNWWYNVDCANTAAFVSVNEAFGVVARSDAARTSAASGSRFASPISGYSSESSRIQQQQTRTAATNNY